MVKSTPEEAGGEWAARLGQSTDKIKRGIDRVTESPGKLAAAQKDKWLARIQERADVWARNTAAVDLSTWKQQTGTIGVQRIAQGANAKKGKMIAFLQQWLPHMQAGQDKLKSMPSVTLEQRKARMNAMFDHNANFRRTP